MRAPLSGLALGIVIVFSQAVPAPAQVTSTPKVRPVEPSKKVGPKIDLNTATVEELQELPGIGPARAALIVKARPFKVVDDLKAIRGITPTIFAEIEPHVTVKAAAMPKAATPKVAMPKDTATAAPAKVMTPKGASTPKSSAASAAREDDPEHQARKKAALAPGKTINLNTATVEELEELPYIGPVRSAAIVKARPFTSIEDVMRVEGIKEGIYGHIKDHIRVK